MSLRSFEEVSAFVCGSTYVQSCMQVNWSDQNIRYLCREKLNGVGTIVVAQLVALLSPPKPSIAPNGP